MLIAGCFDETYSLMILHLDVYHKGIMLSHTVQIEGCDWKNIF
jgi:hypothetical protein